MTTITLPYFKGLFPEFDPMPTQTQFNCALILMQDKFKSVIECLDEAMGQYVLALAVAEDLTFCRKYPNGMNSVKQSWSEGDVSVTNVSLGNKISRYDLTCYGVKMKPYIAAAKMANSMLASCPTYDMCITRGYN